MTSDELRQEMKEQEGDPQIKRASAPPSARCPAVA